MSGTRATPSLGLLLDVDGPLASPRTRRLSQPDLARDLVLLLSAGTPVVLNTGRSHAFVSAHVVAPLGAAGLRPGARLHAVCEKGAVWASWEPGSGLERPEIDESLTVPGLVLDVVRSLTAGHGADGHHGEAMAVDESKLSMATVESIPGTEPARFAAAQSAFHADLVAALLPHGLGLSLAEQQWPDAHGDVPWRIDPSIIATDVESSAVGKDLGAARALTLLAADGPLPRAWCTVGDSRVDYLMADHLSALGLDVVHVDVGPTARALASVTRDYPVLSHPALVDDAAGAAFVGHLAEAARAGRDLRSALATLHW